jgi:HEAT repeat protein
VHSALRTATFAVVLSVSGRAYALGWPGALPRIERDLASSNVATRRAAAHKLATLSATQANEIVHLALNDTDAEVRITAARAVMALHIEQATDAVVPWLKDADPLVRKAACNVLQAMPVPNATAELARALKDADADVRAAAANALGSQGTRQAIAPLARALADASPNVRTEVVRALARFDDPQAVAALTANVQDSWPGVRQAIVVALGNARDPRAVQALVMALSDAASEVRVEALVALGKHKADASVTVIVPLAAERNQAVRHAALHALGAIGSAAAVRALIAALATHEDAMARLERTPVRDALVTAGARVPATVVEALVAVLAAPPTPQAATSAAWVLGELHASESVSAIERALRAETLAPAAALFGIGGAGNATHVPLVLEFLDDTAADVREQARVALRTLLDPSRPDGRAVDPIVAALHSKRTTARDRIALVGLLGRTGAPRASAPLAELVASESVEQRIAAIDAFGSLGVATKAGDETLVAALDDVDPSVRWHAASALETSGGADAQTELLARLTRGDESDRYAVFAALGGTFERVPNERASLEILAALDFAAGAERDARIEAASRTRLPSTIRALTELARRGDVGDRRTVASVLARHRGSDAALALVRTLLNDADASVSAQAAMALGALGSVDDLKRLEPLVTSSHADVAINAAFAIARVAQRAPNSTSIAACVCPHLRDARAGVRTNALIALGAAGAHCDDAVVRDLVTHDPSERVRSAAARWLHGASLTDSANKAALDTCAALDRSPLVARACAASTRKKPVPGRARTVYIVDEASKEPVPGAHYILSFDDGSLQSGTADRRGAVFQGDPPEGSVERVTSIR